MEAVPVYSINSSCGSNPWEVVALGGMNGGFGGANSMWAFLPWLLLFGWGGFGGFGGGYGGRGGCCGGSPLAADLAITDATNIAELKAGANFTAQGVNGIRNSISDLNVNLCNQFSGVNSNITTASYQNLLGQRDLQAQISDCCCKTQTGIASLNYNNAMIACEIKQAIAAEGAATRQLITSQYTADVERKLAEAKQQLFVLEKFGRYADGNSCGCGC